MSFTLVTAVVHARHRRFTHRDAQFLGALAKNLDLEERIVFGGVVENAHFLLSVRELQEQIELFGDRRDVGDARDVSAGVFVRLHDFGALKARHGRGDDRDRARGAGRGLHGGRRDRIDEVDVVRDEASRDRLQRRLIALRVLAVERHFDAFAVAELVQAFHEALHGVVKRFMLDDLDDADRKRLLGRRLRGGRRFVAAREQNARDEHRGEKGGKTGEDGGVHAQTPG